MGKDKAEIINSIEGLNSNNLEILDKFLMALHNPNELDKKNLTIPKWLNILATNAGINFSETLRNALLKELGIESTTQFNDEIEIKGSKFKKINE